jgi:transposase
VVGTTPMDSRALIRARLPIPSGPPGSARAIPPLSSSREPALLNTLHVGIAVSHHRHDVCLLDRTGTPVGKPCAVPNNRPGATELIERVAAVASGYERVLLGLAATGIYWWHLAKALARAPELAPYHVRLVVFNPRLIQGFRDASTAMDQTDPDDAFLIAERLRFGWLPQSPPPDPRSLPLQRLTRYRFHLVRTLVRAKADALTLLFLAASEYARLEPFADLFEATSLAILTEFKTLDELAMLPLEDLVAFIDEQGRRRFADRSEPARLLRQVAADSFRLDDAAVEPVHFALTHALAHIRFIGQQRKPRDRRIARELERFPNTLLSVPGAGLRRRLGGGDRRHRPLPRRRRPGQVCRAVVAAPAVGRVRGG